MGTRGKLEEFPVAVPLRMSEAQRYRLGVLAARCGESLAGTIRALIDEKWEETTDAGQAQEDQSA